MSDWLVAYDDLMRVYGIVNLLKIATRFLFLEEI